jgi:tetratricopeptide (TPR) repeat protein
MTTFARATCFFWIGLLVFGLNSKSTADEIDVRDGKEILGSIQEETATEVIVVNQGKSEPQSIAVNRIVKIRYTGQPAALTRARSMEDAYDLRTAAEEYAKVQIEVKGKPLLLQAAQFGEARVLARLALDESTGLDEAIARLEKLDREHSGSRHHFRSQELLGRLHFEKRDFAKAAAAFDELATAPWPEARLLSAVYHARMLRAQNKLDDALARLNPVLTAKPDSPEQQLIQAEALFEKAACLRGQKQRDAEIETLELAIDRAPAGSSSVQAEAYLALGDAYRATQKPKDALLAFLHVELLFAKHKELHARALYNLSQLWSELGQPDRSAAAQSSLKTEYPNSPWTKKLGS